MDAKSCSHGKNSSCLALSAFKKYSREICRLDQIPDEELEQTAVQCGAEFQYMLARLYLQWDARRLNLAKAIHFAKMAAENGRISAGDLYNELCSQIIKIKTGE